MPATNATATPAPTPSLYPNQIYNPSRYGFDVAAIIATIAPVFVFILILLVGYYSRERVPSDGKKVVEFMKPDDHDHIRHDGPRPPSRPGSRNGDVDVEAAMKQHEQRRSNWNLSLFPRWGTRTWSPLGS
ncbi:hypothetical protein BDZ91DRAFT_796117 [Kalaharituber pfeilii]|nr:hypothetical protein BDZ91DRAFT_796117 [Kalaharituber pfeilii]